MFVVLVSLLMKVKISSMMAHVAYSQSHDVTFAIIVIAYHCRAGIEFDDVVSILSLSERRPKTLDTTSLAPPFFTSFVIIS